MGQILRYHTELPSPDTWDIDKFMCTTFVDSVREAVNKAGWSGRDPEGREGKILKSANINYCHHNA